jgi:clostripain
MKYVLRFHVVLLCCACTSPLFAQGENGWTIMYYAAGSNSSEVDLLSDIGEMIASKSSDGYEVITLIDRIDGHSDDSTTLGENFTDTRLYRIQHNAYEELSAEEILTDHRDGGAWEANMGDARVLKRFVQYCKSHFPARHYMLVLRSHGNGYGMCPDAESGVRDKLYSGELRDILTQEESVDILGLDVCSMAGLENFYEWRPDGDGFSADYILASAPLSAAWAYDDIFGRLQADATGHTTDEDNNLSEGKEEILDPQTMTPLAFSELLIEEIYDSQRWASWGLFDNSVIVEVKQGIDALARLLAQENKEDIYLLIENALGYHHNTSSNPEVAKLTFPYVDAYSFVLSVSGNNAFNSDTRSKADAVALLIDKLVLRSYYGRGYLPETDDFVEHKSGAYLIIPAGHKIFSQSGRTYWAHTNWYHPDDQSTIGDAYGLYDWCSDGAQSGNLEVDNFYELLDYLFDESNSEKGGVNGYQW